MKRANPWMVAALLCAPASWAGSPAEGISSEVLEAHVAHLASDELAGRGTLEAGSIQAARYIAQHFEAAGLHPLPGDGDLLQDIELFQVGFDEEGTVVELGIGSDRRALPLGMDFRPFGFSDTGSVAAPVVFAGYGITSTEHGWDDYAGLDVDGKLVLLLRHEPHENDPDSAFGGTANTEHAQFTRKARNAAAHGALGMLLVTDPKHHSGGDDFRVGRNLRLEPPKAPNGAGDEDGAPPFLSVHVSRTALDALLAERGTALLDLQEAVDAGRSPAELGLHGLEARVSVETRGDASPVVVQNVVGFLPGRDRKLAAEWVVIGAHYDHLGAFAGAGDTIFNGADDNASGIAALLELARAFGARKKAPRRSLVFVAFTAEELGLLGSRAAVERELLPAGPARFMLNFDMIGRNDPNQLEVLGDGFAVGVRELVERANEDVGLDLNFGGDRYAGNSDHDPFYRRDVPFLHLFSGLHEDYHQLGDHAEKVDPTKMQRVAALGYGLVEAVAEARQSPEFLHILGWLGARAQLVGKERRPTFVQVDESSRAHQAGLRAGDELTGVGEQDLSNPEELGKLLRGIEPGSEVELVLMRDGVEHRVQVKRAKPGYLGIYPVPLDAERAAALGLSEGQGVLIRDLVEGGPSSLAGLRAGDVLLSLDGRSLSSSSLRAVLAQIGGGETVEVELVRDGQRSSLALTLGER
jgi:hypothetical protein